MVASVVTTLMTAYQKPALASLIQTSGQVITLLSLYIMTKTMQGNLLNLTFAYSGIPCLFLIVISFFIFNLKSFRLFKPNIQSVRFKLTAKILTLGWQFFIIMLSIVFIYQFMNIIISRNFGPEAVTQYNIAYKYFNVIYMVFVIILNPFWSAFTDAYVKNDVTWMISSLKMLEKLWLFVIPIMLIMLFCSSWIYDIWIGKGINIPFKLSFVVGIFITFQVLSNIYMYLINGIGKVRIQLLIYSSFAIVSVPIMNFCCKYLGLESILIIPTVVYMIQAVFGRIQLNKLILNKAKGIWNL
jgi:O-antigen/teichoic acid export membrane protein